MKKSFALLAILFSGQILAFPAHVVCSDLEGKSIFSIAKSKAKVFGVRIDGLKVIENYPDRVIFQFRGTEKTRAESSWVLTRLEGVLGLNLARPETSALTTTKSYSYCQLLADGSMGTCYDPMTPSPGAKSKTSEVRCEILPL